MNVERDALRSLLARQLRPSAPTASSHGVHVALRPGGAGFLAKAPNSDDVIGLHRPTIAWMPTRRLGGDAASNMDGRISPSMWLVSGLWRRGISWEAIDACQQVPWWRWLNELAQDGDTRAMRRVAGALLPDPWDEDGDDERKGEETLAYARELLEQTVAAGDEGARQELDLAARLRTDLEAAAEEGEARAMANLADLLETDGDGERPSCGGGVRRNVEANGQLSAWRVGCARRPDGSRMTMSSYRWRSARTPWRCRCSPRHTRNSESWTQPSDF